MDDHAYCAAQVRSLDSDRYVTALFAPSPRRADLLALYAFNLELARSREAVSEPALGRIRLQWWRDAVGECYGGVARRHQIVQPLAAAIDRHELSRHLFDRIIDAREADFDPSPPESLEHLVAYAEATSGALNLLALHIQGVRDHRLERAAMATGTAWALAGMLRGNVLRPTAWIGHLHPVGWSTVCGSRTGGGTLSPEPFGLAPPSTTYRSGGYTLVSICAGGIGDKARN